MAKVIKTISFDTERDADLITWLDLQPNVSEAVRVALRKHLEGAIDLGDIYRAVKGIERKIDAGAVTVTAAQSDAVREGDAPGTEEAASNLERLGL